MSIVAFGPNRYPDWPYNRPISGSNMKTSFVINDASDVIQFRLNVPASGTIEQIWLEAGVVTTSGTVKIAFQDHASGTFGPEGFPDGTDTHFATMTISTSNTFFQSGPITNDGTASGTRKTVNAGDIMTIDIRRASGSSYDGNVLYLNSTTAIAEFHDQVPILTPNIFTSADGGSTFSFTQGGLNLAIEMNDGSFLRGPWLPAEFFSEVSSIGLNTTPDEVGLKFVPEATVQANGVWCIGANGNCRVRIYDSSDTVLVETLIGNHGGTSNGQNRYHHFSPTTLDGGSTYRLTLAYLNTSAGAGIYSVTVPASEVMDALPMGVNAHWTERTDEGAWTENTSQRPLIGLLINGIDQVPVINNFTRGFSMQQVGSGMNASLARIA